MALQSRRNRMRGGGRFLSQNDLAANTIDLFQRGGRLPRTEAIKKKRYGGRISGFKRKMQVGGEIESLANRTTDPVEVPLIDPRARLTSEIETLSNQGGPGEHDFILGFSDDTSSFANILNERLARGRAGTPTSGGTGRNRTRDRAGISLGDSLGDNLGDLANTANLISNLAATESLETDINPALVEAPRFTFQRRSGIDRARAAQTARAARRGITASSTQGRGATTAAITASQFDAENEIARREAEREDIARDRFQQQLSQTDAFNAQILNQTRFGNLARRNLRRSLRGQARQAFLQGVVGNQERKDQQRLNRARALAISARSGQTGVSERLLEQFPELAEALNLN